MIERLRRWWCLHIHNKVMGVGLTYWTCGQCQRKYRVSWAQPEDDEREDKEGSDHDRSGRPAGTQRIGWSPVRAAV